MDPLPKTSLYSTLNTVPTLRNTHFQSPHAFFSLTQLQRVIPYNYINSINYSALRLHQLHQLKRIAIASTALLNYGVLPLHCSVALLKWAEKAQGN